MLYSNIKEEFEKYARSRLPGFSEFRPCPDQFVGVISVHNEVTENPQVNGEKCDFLVRVPVNDFIRSTSPCILMILESPHVSEYSGISPRPAAGNGYGDTGRSIRELFGEVFDLHELLPHGNYPLIIINAIQFQCSLGDIKKHRDIMFTQCWVGLGRIDFATRFKSIYRNGDVVVNACTAGGSRRKNEKRIRELVKSEIEVMVNAAFEVEHPCNWMRIRNKALKQGVRPSYRWRS